MLKLILMFRRLMTAFQGTVIFMAAELLRGQVEHLEAEKAARRKGKHGPLTLNMKREAHHDLEAFLWVLIYAMMIHHYDSLTRETDRRDYKVILDTYFGHGCAEVIVKERQDMYLAHSRVGGNRISRWFPDADEQRFFVNCMILVADHDREEEKKAGFGTFKGEIDDTNPVWDISDDESGGSPDEDAADNSGTYRQGKATKSVQKPVAGLRARPPVITYESVVALLKGSIEEL
jgi:hypothetical protein